MIDLVGLALLVVFLSTWSRAHDLEALASSLKLRPARSRHCLRLCGSATAWVAGLGFFPGRGAHDCARSPRFSGDAGRAEPRQSSARRPEEAEEVQEEMRRRSESRMPRREEDAVHDGIVARLSFCSRCRSRSPPGWPYSASSSCDVFAVPLTGLIGEMAWWSPTRSSWLPFLFTSCSVSSCFAQASRSGCITRSAMGVVASRRPHARQRRCMRSVRLHIRLERRYRGDIGIVALTRREIPVQRTSLPRHARRRRHARDLIPPSINLIVYGVITETSIPQLYFAGFLPGFLTLRYSR